MTRDLHGEQAIRLGRAYQHAWVKDIPQSVRWDWETCCYMLSIAKSKMKPAVVGDSIVYSARKSSTHWTLGQGVAAITMLDKGIVTGGVTTGRDEDGRPWMRARISNWAGLSKEQLWRYDRALTALACGDWKPFYKMPPLNVLTPVLKPFVPETEVRLWYVMAGTTPTVCLDSAIVVSHEQQAIIDGAKHLLRKFEQAGGLERWHTARVVE